MNVTTETCYPCIARLAKLIATDAICNTDLSGLLELRLAPPMKAPRDPKVVAAFDQIRELNAIPMIDAQLLPDEGPQRGDDDVEYIDVEIDEGAIAA